jgi:hypothetical protein
MSEEQKINHGDNHPLPNNLADKKGESFSFVEALHASIKAYDPDRSKALDLFEKYYQRKDLDKGQESPPPENLTDDKGGSDSYSFVHALYESIRAYDPDRSKALEIFELLQEESLKKGEPQ